MNGAHRRQLIASIFSVWLASALFPPLAAAEKAQALGRIISVAPAKLNGLALPGTGTLFDGDRLTTGVNGWARILVTPEEQIHLGAQSEIRAYRGNKSIELELHQGRLTLRTRGRGLAVQSNGLIVQPTYSAPAVWEVARLPDGQMVVAAHRGILEVRAANRTLQVPAGQTARIESRTAQPTNATNRNRREPRGEIPADIFGPRSIGNSTLSMQPDRYIGRRLEIIAGTGKGQQRRIVGNTGTTFTVSPDWETVPDETSVFQLVDNKRALIAAAVFGGTTAIALPITLADDDVISPSEFR